MERQKGDDIMEDRAAFHHINELARSASVTSPRDSLVQISCALLAVPEHVTLVVAGVPDVENIVPPSSLHLFTTYFESVPLN